MVESTAQAMKHSFKILALAACLLSPAFSRAETPVPAWTQTYFCPTNGHAYPIALTADSTNNIIVLGRENFGRSTYDYVTVKYSSSGLPLWTNRYDGPGQQDDTPHALSIDSSNNVVVTGTAWGADDDFATIKYSSAGVPLWTNRYNGGDYDEAYAVSVDRSNNVVVCGASWQTQTDYDFTTIKYSSNGVPLWTTHYNGPGNQDDLAYAVATDKNNNAIVTGFSYGATSGQDYATIKYSSAGVPLWTNRYNGPGNDTDQALALALDSSDNVIVTGYSATTYSFPWNYSFATLKYSSNGVPRWTNRYTGFGPGENRAKAVAVDSSDNIFVTGHAIGADGYNPDFTTIKYSSNGALLWVKRFDGAVHGSDNAYAIALDATGNVIVSGLSEVQSNSATYECVTIKYSNLGVPLWTNHNSGLGQSPVPLAIDHAGNALLAGYGLNASLLKHFVTTKIVSVPSPFLSYSPSDYGTVQVVVTNLLQPGTVVVEVSTSLSDWSPLFTNTSHLDTLSFTELNAGSNRFYRAWQRP